MKEKNFFEELQDQLLDELVKRITSGEATAADLKLAKEYVKEAGIEVYKTNKKISYIGKKFGNADDVLKKMNEE